MALVYSTENQNSYRHFEKQSRDKINRRCIDGRITGCGKCVGYCRYNGHPGFLTREHRKEHDCLGKGCYYYLPKKKYAAQKG